MASSGLLISALTASAALSREIEDRTVLTVISKPVSRVVFIVGKFAGVAGAVAVAYYINSLAFLMIVRHGVIALASQPLDIPVLIIGLTALGASFVIATAGNLLFGWAFFSAFIFAGLVLFSAAMGLIGFIGKQWQVVPFGSGISPQLIVAMILAFLAVLIFTSVAIAASTRLGQVMTLLVCVAVLCVGYLHPFLFARREQIPALVAVGWLVPNLRFFDVQESLAQGRGIPSSYVLLAGGYSMLYVAAVLSIGSAVFCRRSLEPQSTSGTLPSAVNVIAWLGRAFALAGGITALALASVPGWHTVTALIILAGLLAVSVFCWIVWGAFARGARWAYWIVLVTAGGGMILGLAAVLVPRNIGALDRGGVRTLGAAMACALAALGLLLLLLPGTRRIFRVARL